MGSDRSSIHSAVRARIDPRRVQRSRPLSIGAHVRRLWFDDHVRAPIAGLNTAAWRATLAVAFLLSPATASGVFAATAVAARSSPTCTPATLNTSAVLGGAVTVSPLPGSRDSSPQTQISFLGVPAKELSDITVVGSRSGARSGRLEAYSQADGASFLPSGPFVEGERVTVRFQLHSGQRVQHLADQFAIATQDTITSIPETIHHGTAQEVQSFHSRPDLLPPTVAITARSPATASGDEFVAPYSGPGQAGPMILDPNGGLVWFKPLPTYTSATNLRVQEYRGEPVLTWWQGDISVHGFGLGEDVVADDTYKEIAHVKAGNGLPADLHEFQLTPTGTALITAYDPILCDLSSVAGSHAAAITDGVLQEIDVKTGLVKMQWTSLDHIALNETYQRATYATARLPLDFFHINSINLDRDGSLLISARNTWAAYDLDHRSGQVAWRLGGKRSSFALGPGVQTAWQHDPRELPNGSISLFDNGSAPAVHTQSRGIVVSLDPQHRKATLTGQFLHTPPIVADSQGNMQALPNGDWFVGWGQAPDFSEFSPSGQLLFDGHFPAHTQSYRSFRFPWTGAPAHAPALAVTAAGDGTRTAYASWNGSTLVAAWRVLAGASVTSLQPVAQVARSGFETAVALPPTAPGPYVRVQALDASGGVLRSSGVVSR
jgi:hypothetical protein